MEPYFVEEWNYSKGLVRQAIMEKLMEDGNAFGFSYQTLFTIMMDQLFQAENWKMLFQREEGCYSGKEVFLFEVRGNISITSVRYGSCSCCDTMRQIHDETNLETQVDDLLTLCLHMIQKCRFA